MICPNCGIFLQGTHNFCPNCGMRFKKKSNAPIIIIITVASLFFVLFFVSCVGFIFSDTTEQTVVNIPEFKNQCISITYDELARDPNKYLNTKVKLIGEIIDIQESGNNVICRINITKGEYDNYTDTIWVNYKMKQTDKKFLQDDIVNLWGVAKGTKTYTSVLGASITLPQVDAVAMELIQ